MKTFYTCYGTLRSKNTSNNNITKKYFQFHKIKNPETEVSRKSSCSQHVMGYENQYFELVVNSPDGISCLIYKLLVEPCDGEMNLKAETLRG